MDLHPTPCRAHSIVLKAGADTAEHLAWELRRLADDIEHDRLTVGCSGSPSAGSLYSYRVAPEQTHDAYFSQVDEILAAKKAAANADTREQSNGSS